MTEGVVPYDRQPPFDLQAEVSVLGGMMIDAQAANESRTQVAPADFYREAHRRIFRAMCGLLDTGSALDPVTLQAALKDTGELDASGGITYLADLLDAVPTAANITYHANIVRDKARLRGVIEAGTQMIRSAYDSNGQGASKIVRAAEESLLGLAEGRGDPGFLWVKEILWPTFEEIEKDQENKTGICGIPTGFHDLDRMTTGLYPGDLTIIAARPSMGKTALAWGIAANAAIEHQVPVAVSSLEMNSTQLLKRGLAVEGRVDLQHLRRGELSPDEYQRLAAAAGHLNTAPIWIDDKPRGTVGSIRAKLRNVLMRQPVELLIVDYIQLMESEGENRTQQVGKISRGLKALARDLDIHVLALSQLSRACERRSPPRPILSDLRDSGDIEQDADNVLMLWRPEYYAGPVDNDGNSIEGKAEVIIAKQRNGPTGKIALYFHKTYTRFDSLSTHGPEAQL